MSWHQNTLFLAEMSSAENEQLALKDFHFCYIQKPRLNSYRGKTSMTFQTLPKKNTSDSRAWGWRRGVRRKGKWKKSHNKENIMLLEMKLHDAGTPPESPRDWLSTRWWNTKDNSLRTRVRLGFPTASLTYLTNLEFFFCFPIVLGGPQSLYELAWSSFSQEKIVFHVMDKVC